MALIDELLVGLGFEYDAGEAKKFSDDIGKTVGIVKELAKVALAAATALTGIVVASSLASDEQGKLADEINETITSINALQFAQQIAGGTADGMANSLRQLTLRASEAARGVGSGVEAFGMLGISTTDANGRIKSTSNLLKEVSGRMQGLDHARQIELADKLGLSDSIRLLQLGPAAIAELTAKSIALGEATEEDARVSAEFNDALVEMWSVTKQLSRVLTRTLGPILNDMVDTFTDWWIINRDLIEQNIPKWIDQFTTAIKLLSVAVGAFIAMRVLIHLYQMIALMRGLTLAALALNASFFLLPFILSGLAIAFGLLAEDAKVFFEGGESFIGDMLEKYPEWAGEIRTVASVLQGVYNLTMMIFDGWDKIFGLFREEGADAMNQALKDKGLGALTKEIGVTDEQSGPVNDILKNIGLGFLTREIGIFDSGTLDTPLTSRNENMSEEINSKPFSWMDFLKSEIGVTGEKSGIVNDFLKNIGLGFLTREVGMFDSGSLDTPLEPSTLDNIKGFFEGIRPNLSGDSEPATTDNSSESNTVNSSSESNIFNNPLESNTSNNILEPSFFDNITGILAGFKSIISGDSEPVLDSGTFNATIEPSTLDNIKSMFGELKSNLLNNQSTSNGMMSLPTSSQVNNVTTVENIEISINGAGQNPDDIAQSVYDVFLQTSQDLNSAVDQ